MCIDNSIILNGVHNSRSITGTQYTVDESVNQQDLSMLLSIVSVYLSIAANIHMIYKQVNQPVHCQRLHVVSQTVMHKAKIDSDRLHHN